MKNQKEVLTERIDEIKTMIAEKGFNKYYLLFPIYLAGYSADECIKAGRNFLHCSFEKKTLRKYMELNDIKINPTEHYLKKKNERPVSMHKDGDKGTLMTFENRYECIDYLQKTIFPDHTYEQLRKGIQKVASGSRKQYMGYVFKEEDIPDPKIRENELEEFMLLYKEKLGAIGLTDNVLAGA